MKGTWNLFYDRLIKDFSFHYKVFKTIANWIIWLYIVVPYTIFLIYQYIMMWQGAAEWANYVSYSGIIFFLYLFSWSGHIRLFIELADQLILSQRHQWIDNLTKFGVIYSFFRSLLSTLIIIMIFTPILLKYLHIDSSRVVLLFFVTFFMRLLHMFIKQLLPLYVLGFKRIIAYLPMLTFSFGAFYTTSMLSISTSFIIILITFQILSLFLLYKHRLTIKWGFHEDCIREQEYKLQIVRLFLNIAFLSSGSPIKKMKKNRKKPFILRKSNKLFKNRNATNGLIEFYLKSILRNKTRVIGLFQLLSLSLYGIFIAPTWVKIFIWLATIYFIFNNLKGIWLENQESGFLSLFHWDEEIKVPAIQKSIFYTALPFIILISFFTSLMTFSLFYSILFIGIGVFIHYFLSKMLIYQL